MNENINHPYAKLFEMVMGIIPEAKKLLYYFGDSKLVEGLDLDTLKTVHGTFKGGQTGLSNFITDMLYSCKWKEKEAYVHILLEHKSWLENPKQQILLYLILAYNQQKLDWKRKREEAKKKAERENKKLPNEAFKPTPIIPIVFYHGHGKWKDYKFSDQFDLPEEWLKDFIPDVKVFVIDMAEYPDSYIEKMGASFLQPMLFMFKHKNDKNFLQQNIKKIFKFVEELTEDKLTQRFLYTIFYFMIQTFQLQKAEVDKIMKKLPVKNKKNMNMVQGTVMSVIDQAMQDGLLKGRVEGRMEGRVEGRVEGLVEGLVKGLVKGKQINELKTKIEYILTFIKNFHTLNDAEVAILCKTTKEFVLQVRQTFQQPKEPLIKSFTREAFKNIPHITEKDFLEMETTLLKVWNEFKKTTTK